MRPDDHMSYEDESRLSLLAVSALALSLLCFVPALGVLAAVLGVVAFVTIGRSSGRRRGRGLAIVAISIGAISTTLWVATGMWVVRFGDFYRNTVTVRAAMLVSPGEAGWAGARAVMTEQAASATSDSDFEQFVRALEAHYGPFVEAPREWGAAWETFADSIRGSGNTNPRGSPDSIPAPLRFANGNTSVFVIFVKQTWMTDDFRIDDAFALLPDRNAVTLRKDGPARDEALKVGFAPLHGEAALPEQGSTSKSPEAPAPQPAGTHGPAGGHGG